MHYMRSLNQHLAHRSRGMLQSHNFTEILPYDEHEPIITYLHQTDASAVMQFLRVKIITHL